MLAFQFCGSSMIAEGITLAGPTLAPNQALLLAQQPFAYRGKRDTLRMRVHARVDGREQEVTATLPIQSAVAKTAFRFPLRGAWFAAVGPTMHTGHRWAVPEEFGYDIAKLGEGDLSHRGSGTQFSDYYAYGAPVFAAADGIVTAAVNDQPENPAALRRPDEIGRSVRRARAGNPDVAVGQGRQRDRRQLRDDQPWQRRALALCAHAARQRPCARGREGRGGSAVGKLGSSGNSTEPHLHFQVCDAPDPMACAGIPVQFQNISLPYADYPRPLQSGDVVLAK